MSTPVTTVVDAIADAAAAEGTGVVFATLARFDPRRLEEAFSVRGIRLVCARTDHGTVAMADGYARTSGRPGVCLLGVSLGESSGATAFATALRRGSCLVVVGSGDRDPVARSLGAEGTSLWSSRGQHLADSLHLAFRAARLGRPAVVSAPDLGATVAGEFSYVPSAASLPAAQRVHADASLVDVALELLRTSRRPIVVAGRGAVVSDAAEQVAALAEQLGAPLATTLQGKGFFHGHPAMIGFAGGFGSPEGEALFGQADCVVAVGAGLNAYTTKKGRLFAGARVIQVESDPRRVGDALPVDLALIGDARAVVAALLAGLQDEPARAPWTETPRPSSWDEDAETPDDGLDPRAVAAALDRVLPQARTVVLDGGHFRSFVIDGVGVPEPAAFVDCVDFGAISMSLPLSIGAALGAPERRCVALMGDGGFSMTASELETVARCRIPLTVVVFNDNAYGGELRQLEIKDSPVHAVLFDNPDFAQLARSFGLRAERIEELAQLDAVGDVDEPLFLDVLVSRKVKFRYHPIIEELALERARLAEASA